MNKLLKTINLVRFILENYPETRNDDALLYVTACKAVNPSIDMFPFGTVFTHYKTYGLPSYKSVERARRKLQRENPELAATKEVKEARTEQEGKFKAFALDKGII